jgi:hypothetical protein
MSQVEQLSPEEAVAMMSEEAIVCRDLSHAWKPYYANRISGGFERALRCGVCGTERAEILDSWGRLINRKYGYPEGYIVKGTGRMDADFRAKIRLTSVERAVAS